MLSLAIIAGLGLAYRIRGHRPDGGVLSRIMHPVFTLRPLWAASVFGVVYLLTGDLWIAGAVAVGEWIGLHIPHAEGQDMGTWRGDVTKDVTFMAGVGVLRGILVMLALIAPTAAVETLALMHEWTGYGLVLETPLVLQSDFAHLPTLYAIWLPLSYFVGWRIPWRVPHVLRGGIEWSELLTGASRGVVFLIVFA